MDPTTTFKLAIIYSCFAFCLTQQIETSDEWTLRLLHTNDMNARFAETTASSTDCPTELAQMGKCYGGFARLATLIRQARNSTTPTIFLNAGNTYAGNKRFTAHKLKIVSALLNILSPDVASLGNHEFDNGISSLIPFINAAAFPIVAANLDLKNEWKLAKTKLAKSVIISTTDGHTIGVIGYLTPKTKLTSATGNVIFLDEIESIREEVHLLQAANVTILIALGHSGFEVDKRIAAEVDGLDLVIGAHDKTFLYNGPPPDQEIPVGPYPTEVVGVGGRKVYVAQAYAYTKYLGNLSITFDSEGEIKKIVGNPILLYKNVAKSVDVYKELSKWKPGGNTSNKRVVGTTRVLLDGSKPACRMGECNLGNLIVDSMVEYNIKNYAGSEGWTDAAVAILISGTIQASIKKSSDNKITSGDVIDVLPSSDKMVKMNLTGDIIHQMLEHSVDRLIHSVSDLSGAFLQVSGLKVAYDLSKPYGERVVEVSIRCASCEIPIFEEVVKNRTYTVLMIDFMANGGEGYMMLSEIKSNSMGVSIDEVLIDHLVRYKSVHPGIEGRIRLLNPELLHDNITENMNDISSNTVAPEEEQQEPGL